MTQDVTGLVKRLREEAGGHRILRAQAADVLAAQQATIAELREDYAAAIEDIESWGAYATEYFQEKHGLAECLKYHRAALAESEGGTK